MSLWKPLLVWFITKSKYKRQHGAKPPARLCELLGALLSCPSSIVAQASKCETNYDSGTQASAEHFSVLFSCSHLALGQGSLHYVCDLLQHQRPPCFVFWEEAHEWGVTPPSPKLFWHWRQISSCISNSCPSHALLITAPKAHFQKYTHFSVGKKKKSKPYILLCMVKNGAKLEQIRKKIEPEQFSLSRIIWSFYFWGGGGKS